MLPGTEFQPVLPDTLPPNGVEHVILMSGRLYYDLVKEHAVRGLEGHVTIVRIEELTPFPFVQLADAVTFVHWYVEGCGVGVGLCGYKRK